MNQKHLLVAAMAALPVTAFAETGAQYECAVGELVRRVEIMYETGMTLPCEVHYYKDTEAPGQSQVLWRAMNEQGYCESKARDFIAKLENSGWSCTSKAAPAAPQPAVEPQPASEAAAPRPVDAVDVPDDMLEPADDSADLDPVPPDESPD